MSDDLKKLTFQMDKADGESRTVIVIATSATITGRLVRTMFDKPITVHTDETMRLVKEESIPNPGIVGTKPDFVIVDDFNQLEARVHANLCEIGGPEHILDKAESCWVQVERPYGKKYRRYNR